MGLAGSAHLMQATMPVVDAPRCALAFPQHEASTQVCAGFDDGGVESCQADVGGPLVALDSYGEAYQVGISSYGFGCGRTGKYGVYTRVSAFANWIAAYVPQAILAPRTEEPDAAAAGDALDALIDALAPANGRVSVVMQPNDAYQLGQPLAYDITPSVGGLLLVLELGETGQVVEIYPNKLAERLMDPSLPAGATLRFPDAAFPFGFCASPPEKARILAVIVPESFPYDTTIWSETARMRGFDAALNPAGIALNLAEQVQRYAAAHANAPGENKGEGEAAEPLPGFALGVASYRVEPLGQECPRA
jgi:hypothetical protein